MALPPRSFQILLALAEGPLHGYGIRSSVEERTEGAVRLGSGTLYEAVHRLAELGQIEEVPAPEGEAPSSGPPRRFYTLSNEGRRVLREELVRMESAVQYARRLDLLPDG